MPLRPGDVNAFVPVGQWAMEKRHGGCYYDKSDLDDFYTVRSRCRWQHSGQRVLAMPVRSDIF